MPLGSSVGFVLGLGFGLVAPLGLCREFSLGLGFEDPGFSVGLELVPGVPGFLLGVDSGFSPGFPSGFLSLSPGSLFFGGFCGGLAASL